MLTDADSNSNFLCVVQGVIGIGSNAKCAFPVDTRFGGNGPIFYIADFDGRDNVVATVFTDRSHKPERKQKRCIGDNGSCNEMDADYICGNVCVDAGGIGPVLDGFKRVRYIPNIHNKKAIKQ